MKILRVFIKNHNGAWIDTPHQIENLSVILANWKIDGVLVHQDGQSLPVAIPWDSWSFCCLLTVGENQVPESLQPMFQGKPN